ncbi:alpha/beta fold hydrolase [Glaciecola petra]|uniref:Alpha/beta fold hydrolase n=1 Tax=Glaciecola petra TaxID=3075602 RepID=A0ABU2ZTC6_9ALTE|nr:alpha/beta fold hydrolase [Aestuariibacter sp. P117]MDT0595511.1 alpha/beta fold hydrolase [Aestuariibacter sp. P117]
MSYFFSDEKTVSQFPNTPYMDMFDGLEKDYYVQADGTNSFYCFAACDEAKGVIVLSTGRSECLHKYAELIYEFKQNGYSTFIFDHRGQGLSSRLTEDSHIGHIGRFDDYVNDMKCLIDEVLPEKLNNIGQTHLPKYLVCHSMGCAIGTLFVHKHPSYFSKLILSAPMFGVQAPVPEWFSYFVVSTVVFVRQILRMPIVYFWGQGKYIDLPFEANTLTNCPIRYKAFRETMTTHADNQLGGMSFEWFKQAIIAMREIRKQASSINTHTLILQAEEEQIVDNNNMSDVAKAMNKSQLTIIQKSQHEIFFEKDEARKVALSHIYDFIRA